MAAGTDANGAAANSEMKKARFAWCMYDWANSSFATVILAAVLPVYFASLVPPEGVSLEAIGLSRHIPATALWGYAISLSMILVAASAPFLGSLADRGGHRRQMLIFFTLLGATATALLALAGDGRYLLAAAFFIIANFSFASGNVFYNAFLSPLAGEEGVDRLSSRGFAYGYLGGGVALLLVFALIQGHALFGLPDAAAASRAGFVLVGAWWLLFALPSFFRLRDLPAQREARPRGYLQTFTEIRGHRDLILFLVAFLCYNDGIQTMIAVSAIFGKEELGLGQTTILGCFLMIQIVAMPGTLLFGRLAERWDARKAISLALILFIAVTIYAYFITKPWQFWLLGFVVALIFGGAQALSRSLFVRMIPPGKESEFFGFYAISAKFASIFGPLLFAVIAHLTGSARLSILALGALFVAGLLLLWRVDMERGEARALETPS